MKKLIFLSVVLVILLAILIIDLTSGQDKPLISPLLKKEKVLGINQWFPKDVFGSQENAPLITARGALFIESKTGLVLFEKNAREKLPIASLVKVMTVLIALEHKSMDDKFTVSKRAAEFEPDKMFLIPGEKFSLKELLYGIFLISANDGAEVIAEQSVGDRKEFINLMNAKAEQLGMKDTYFVNPTGLDEDSNNSYSTAYDLAILTRYLIKTYPHVIEITQTPHVYFEAKEDRQSYDMYTGINLVTTYPGVVGFKTGYTPEAGLTLITLARKDGEEIIGILLGTENRRDEAKELLDYSFKKLGV